MITPGNIYHSTWNKVIELNRETDGVLIMHQITGEDVLQCIQWNEDYGVGLFRSDSPEYTITLFRHEVAPVTENCQTT